ncbi:hypothetical protein ACE6H2_015747 [Prunus campanulata]
MPMEAPPLLISRSPKPCSKNQSHTINGAEEEDDSINIESEFDKKLEDKEEGDDGSPPNVTDDNNNPFFAPLEGMSFHANSMECRFV